MENVPKDLLLYMTLDYDLDTILSLCQTSKRFNRIICQNNLFWLNKIKKEYGLSKDDIPTIYLNNLRKYYQDLERAFRLYINDVYINSVIEGRLDKVKASLFRGADINTKYVHDGTNVYRIPIIDSIIYDHPEIYYYLVDKIIKSRDDAEEVMSKFVDNTKPTTFYKNELGLILIKDIIPRTYKYLAYSKELWNIIFHKLDNFYDALVPNYMTEQDFENFRNEIRQLI